MRILCLMWLILTVSFPAFGSFWPFSFFQDNGKTDTTVQEENQTGIQKQGDVLDYINNRHPEFFEQLKTTYHGLPSEEVLDDLLQKQNYVEVLNYLWSEGNQTVRIQWLEKKLREYHPILIAELALEYIRRDLSIHAYLFSSLPLLDVAVCLAEIDSFCTSDQNVSEASEFLKYQYGNRIFETLQNHCSRNALKTFWKRHYISFKKNTFKQLRKALLRFDDPKQYAAIPSPRWVFSHGRQAVVNGVECSAFPENEWAEIRRKAAQESLRGIREDEKKLVRNPNEYIREVFQNM